MNIISPTLEVSFGGAGPDRTPLQFTRKLQLLVRLLVSIRTFSLRTAARKNNPDPHQTSEY